jgi:predicted kinase
MGKHTLYLMLGYPGAGKTTIAKHIHELTGAVHLSSDELRLELFPQPTYSQEEHAAVYKALDQKTEALLAQGKSVIYDANLNRYQHRAEKYDICKKTGAKAVVIWVQVPKQFARERAVLRGHRHLVPQDETFESMFDRIAHTIEEPKTDEHVVTIEGVDVTANKVAATLAKL